MTIALVSLLAAYLALLAMLARGLRPASRRPTSTTPAAGPWPSVDLVVPAHDEAVALPATLAALRRLDYPGPLRVIVVDDRSTDGTAAIVRDASARDPRLRLVQVADDPEHRTPVAPAFDRAGGRPAPKVHAVAAGIRAGRGDIIVTTDADCVVGRRWLRAMVAPFADPQVVWTLGPVTTHAPGQARGFRERFEAIDWLSLMLVSRSLARLGGPWATSANAQAYRRAAFERAGGFGAAAAAPSGDEDLLAQRLARLPGARAVFVDDPDARVWTRPMPSWAAWLRQRWRWASRFRHVRHYHPAYWCGIVLLGAVSVVLVAALATLPWRPDAASVVLAAWASKAAAEWFAVRAGLRALGRADLIGGTLAAWALLHPFAVAAAATAAALRSGSWRAATGGLTADTGPRARDRRARPARPTPR